MWLQHRRLVLASADTARMLCGLNATAGHLFFSTGHTDRLRSFYRNVVCWLVGLGARRELPAFASSRSFSASFWWHDRRITYSAAVASEDPIFV